MYILDMFQSGPEIDIPEVNIPGIPQALVIKREEKRKKEQKIEEKVNEVLNRPLVARNFSSHKQLQCEYVAAVAQ